MQVEFSTRVWLEKLDLACMHCLSAMARKKKKSNWQLQSERSSYLIECFCSRPGWDRGKTPGPGFSCSPVADIAHFLPWEDVAIVDGVVGGGAVRCDGWLRVLARVRGGSIVRAAGLPCYPHIQHPASPQGISRLFSRGPRGPFHHYTHDFLMQ